MSSQFDITVIGGGLGGYVAALRAAQLGARAAVVERDRLGGTCLVRGCIPTKALLQSSELYSLMERGADFGIEARNLAFNLTTAQARKTKIVDQLVKGVEGLLRSAGVEVVRGHGVIRRPDTVEVGDRSLQTKDIIIATGSIPARLPIKGAEHTIDSDQILELKEIPPRLVVIGGGVVGMEFGALYAALGSSVVILEMLPEILPMAEAEIVSAYRKHFEGLGAVIHTGARVEEVGKGRAGRRVTFTLEGQRQQVEADVVLVATGRAPYTESLGLDALGVETERGRIKVDQHLRTSRAGIWAVGDVIGGMMLAHVASYEGICAAENILEGRQRIPDYHAVPNCIYTDPEIAQVGLSEQEAKDRGHLVQVGRFPFQASGRALTLGQAEGMIKVVAEVGSGRLLGIHMVGPRVTDVISEAALAVQHGLTIDQLDQTIHAHPTLAESLLEASLAAEGRAIHVPNRRRSQPAVALTAGKGEARPAPTVTEAISPGPSSNFQEEHPVVRPVQATNKASRAKAGPGKVELKKENRDQLLELYRTMYLIRRFEERTQEQYTKAKIGGYCHLNLGEEATVVGSIVPLRPGDYIYTSYREHGHALARGVDPGAVMAELFGKETGVSRGRGGSMHIFDYSRRFMGGYGIVGGHLPLACGSAFASRYKGTDDVVLCLFGDGASNIGAFHESLNISKVFKLPVVWMCVNNQYGMGTTVERASAVKEIKQRACAYDMEAISVDGMDVLEVLARTSEIVEKTRQDSQPRFIEAVCYRFKGHSVVDPDKYRDPAEKERWMRNDPVKFFEHRLREAAIAGEEDYRKIHDEVEAEVDETIRFADTSPDPRVEDLHKYLYAGEFDEVPSRV